MEWQMADAGEGKRIGHGGAEGRNVIAECVQVGVVSGYRPQVPHVSQSASWPRLSALNPTWSLVKFNNYYCITPLVAKCR